jgi:hypothetical protein
MRPRRHKIRLLTDVTALGAMAVQRWSRPHGTARLHLIVPCWD